MITIDLLCESCGARAVATVPREEASYETRWQCEECLEPTLKRIPSAPTVLKASWPDGYRSKHSQDLKEASQLEIAMADMPQDKRAGISREIRKLKELRR